MTRLIGPRRSEKMGALFLANNRNKRSIVLDLKKAEAQAALCGLVERSDVLLHSVRTPAAARLGLDYETLSALNPGLIFCHLLGFSDSGAYAGRAAYDDIVQSLSGLAMLQKVVADEPRYIPSIVADKTAAVHAAYAIALALFERERSGRGQKVGVPMLEAMVAFTAAEHLGGYVFEPPSATWVTIPSGGACVGRSGRRTATSASCTDDHWRRFLLLIDDPEIAADPGFMTMKGRQANIERVWAEVGRQLAKHTNAEWLELIGSTDIPFAVLNELEDLLDDPHLASIGFWKLMQHPTEGTLRMPASPIEMSRTPPSIRRLPPRLGEHTAEFLGELGYDASAVAVLTS